MDIVKIKDIFIKEVTIETRQQFALGGILLFAATVVFLIYKSFNTVTAREWTILVWIVMLFAGLNAVVKSFLQEKSETYLYYYTLFDPVDLVIAKTLYNFIFLVIIFCLIHAAMFVFVGIPIKFWDLYLIGSTVGILGIAIVFTFISLIASTDQSNSTLMSILALPLVLPILLLLLKISFVSARLMADTAIYEDIWMLVGIDSVMFGAMILLFPSLWKS